MSYRLCKSELFWIVCCLFKVIKNAVEIIKTYSYRELHNNKIEQLPPGIFSNLISKRRGVLRSGGGGGVTSQ